LYRTSPELKKPKRRQFLPTVKNGKQNMDLRWVLCENFGEKVKKTTEKYEGGKKVNTRQEEKGPVVSNSC